MTPRLYCGDLWRCAPAPPAQALAVPEEQSHYLTQVLRLNTGSDVQIFDGRGHRCTAKLLQVDRRSAQLGDFGPVIAQSPGPVQITLVQGLARNDRMDWVIEKATELGVAQLVPVQSERSAIQLTDKRAAQKSAHWRKTIQAACMQCGQDHLPVLNAIISLRNYLQTRDNAARLLVLDPLAPLSFAATIGQLRSKRTAEPSTGLRLDVMVGPESGFSEPELVLASQHAATRVNLGPRILRTETAGVTALAVIQSLVGDMGG